MAADRGAYICQSQSLNLFINSPNASKLTQCTFTHGRRIETGMYYLRTQAASQAVKFTVENQGGKKHALYTRCSADVITMYLPPIMLNGRRLCYLFGISPVKSVKSESRKDRKTELKNDISLKDN